MPIRPEFLVRDLEGRPQPPSDLLAKLKQYDDRIGLLYTNCSWAITERWRDTDPRWERVQQGEMQAEFAFDICGSLPITCSLDEALPYIERELRTYSAEQFAALRHTVLHWNDAVQDAVMENAILGAVSNDLDRSNIVTPGISTPVLTDLASNVVPVDRMAKARAAKAEKALAAKAQSA